MTFDAVLLLSFGGPEGPADVRPFLENVTRGRGVPPERLDAVAEHYLHFGGVSPINQLNRDIIAAVRAEFTRQGIELPVYFGNRNWHPMIEDTVAEMKTAGVRRALVFPTSAYGGYSACRQYDEDILRARAAVNDAPDLVKLRQFFDHPLFIDAVTDATRAALAEVPAGSRLVFTAHSIPVSADKAAGPAGGLYSAQLRAAAGLVAERLGVAEYDLVWQSRSGPPQVPWLEPDIADHIEALHADGVAGVAVSPIGFVSDHLEVVWDLDTEARELAEKLGVPFARAATAGTDPRFAELVVELIREHLAAAPARGHSGFPALGCTVNGQFCAPGCCEPARRPARPPA